MAQGPEEIFEPLFPTFLGVSAYPDQEKRKALVWQLDKKLQLDGARPLLAHYEGATCYQPQVKGFKMMVNSVYNGWRFEDVGDKDLFLPAIARVRQLETHKLALGIDEAVRR